MVEYLCYRCGYIGKQKNHLKNHLNRKFICKPVLDDISIEEIRNYYFLEIAPKQHPNNTQTTPKQHPIFLLENVNIVIKVLLESPG